MAKSVTKAKVPAKLATVAGVPAHLSKVTMSGKGVSTDSSDNLVPMARVLQPLSPEVLKGQANYIKGAEAGDVLIKNAPTPILKGEEGFLFQPCFFHKGFVEWLPRDKGGGGGGGFVILHKEEPKDAESKPDPMNPERTVRIRKSNGNLLVETRYHGGFIITDENPPLPCVIPFAGSGHTVSKTWMMLMNSKEISGHKADSWAVLYRFTTKMKSKNNNNWFLFDIDDAGVEVDGIPSTSWVPSIEDYERGKALHQSLASGQRTFDASAAEEENTNRM